MNCATEALTDERRARRMDRAKRERDERTTAKCPEAAVEDNKGRKRASRSSGINKTRCSCTATAPWPRAVDCKEADRRTMAESGEESEERTKEGQGDGWREQLSAWSMR